MIRILHVDDDPDSREQVKFWLTRSSDHIEVTSAESAQEALEELESSAFNCIVCDYDMPQMDGIQLLSSLRKRGEETAFIILSNFCEDDLVASARQAGADDYCSKEKFLAERVVLLDSIERAMKTRQSRRASVPKRGQAQDQLECGSPMIASVTPRQT
jgi:CheY-like chemotaxis protein